MNINGLSLTDSMTFNIELENEQNKSFKKQIVNRSNLLWFVVCSIDDRKENTDLL